MHRQQLILDTRDIERVGIKTTAFRNDAGKGWMKIGILLLFRGSLFSLIIVFPVISMANGYVIRWLQVATIWLLSKFFAASITRFVRNTSSNWSWSLWDCGLEEVAQIRGGGSWDCWAEQEGTPIFGVFALYYWYYHLQIIIELWNCPVSDILQCHDNW